MKKKFLQVLPISPARTRQVRRRTRHYTGSAALPLDPRRPPGDHWPRPLRAGRLSGAGTGHEAE